MLAPGFDLRFGPVEVAITSRVAAVPVGDRLDQLRAAAVADRAGHLGHHRVDDRDVVAIDPDTGNAVGLGSLGDGDPHGARLRHRHRVLVVLAEEDDGHIPEGGEVEGLVKAALVGSTVAEDAEHQVFLLFHLDTESQPDCDRDAPTDDAVGAQVAPAHIGDVHRAAAAATVAALLAHQLGEHRSNLGTFGHTVPVAAVMAEEKVALRQGKRPAAGNRFLSDREMEGAVDLANVVELLRFLLEKAIAPHQPQRLEQAIAAKLEDLVPRQWSIDGDTGGEFDPAADAGLPVSP